MHWRVICLGEESPLQSERPSSVNPGLVSAEVPEGGRYQRLGAAEVPEAGALLSWWAGWVRSSSQSPSVCSNGYRVNVASVKALRDLSAEKGPDIGKTHFTLCRHCWRCSQNSVCHFVCHLESDRAKEKWKDKLIVKNAFEVQKITCLPKYIQIPVDEDMDVSLPHSSWL